MKNQNNQFAELVSEIEVLLKAKPRVTVAISGFGGSGKTTLAEQLKLKLPDSNLIQIDNFLINRGRGGGWAGGYDWERFEGVLKVVKAGHDLHYRFYDWQKNALSNGFIDEKLCELVIVEGARILQPNLMDYYDFSVWVNADLDTSTQRGEKRDEANWQDKSDQDGLQAHLDTWHKVWTPKDKEYFEKFRPDKLANFIYDI